jgi:hypothetical protein
LPSKASTSEKRSKDADEVSGKKKQKKISE